MPGIPGHLAVFDDHLIVVTSDGNAPVVRISEPDKPVVVSSLEVDSAAYGVAVDAGFAYVVNGKSLRAFDMADPSVPTPVSALDLGGFPSDVAVRDGFAYVACWDALRVVDVSQPTVPREVASLTVDDPFAEIYYVAVRDGIAVLLGRDAHVIDVADPLNPEEVGQYHPFQHPQDVEIRGDLVYLAISTFDDDSFSPHGGFEVFDVSAPADPVGRGQIEVSDDVYTVSLGQRHAFLAAGGEGLRVIDVSDADQLRDVASDVPSLRAADSIAVMGQQVFVGNGAQIIAFHADDQAGEDPIGESRVALRRAFDPITASGGYLYVGAGERMVVIDAREAGNMRQLATVQLDDHLSGLQAAGQNLYMANKGQFLIYDVSDPTAPSEVGALPFPEWAQDVAVSDGIAYVSTYVIEPDASHQSVVMVDVSDPRLPRRAGELDLAGPFQLSFLETNVSAASGVAYIGGSVVVDARVPTSPRRAYQLRRAGGPVDSVIQGDRLYTVSRGLPGEAPCLRAFDTTNPLEPRQSAAYPLPDSGWGEHLDADGELLYVAVGAGGALVFQDTGLPDGGRFDSRCAAPQPWEPLRLLLPVALHGH